MSIKDMVMIHLYQTTVFYKNLMAIMDVYQISIQNVFPVVN